MSGHLAVRSASAADMDLVTSIVTLAFARDPLWAHAMARPGGGSAHHGEFWRLFIEGALRYPCTRLTSGGEATSVWIPPGGTEMTPGQEQRLADLATSRLGPAAAGYLELISRFEAAHPRASRTTTCRCWPPTLITGKGIGMRLLGHDLEQIDAEHLPAYLESSNPANNTGTPAWASRRTASSVIPAAARS